MKTWSFVWLFEEFLEAMGGLQLENFITDQDAAMRSAILTSFLACRHRKCRWHIMQNAQADEVSTRQCSQIVDLGFRGIRGQVELEGGQMNEGV